MRLLGKGFFKIGGVTIFMVILLGLLMCPQDSFGAEQGCHACAAGFQCPDLCDCQVHGIPHEHEFRDDTFQIQTINLVPPLVVCMPLPFEAPQRPLGGSTQMAAANTLSHAARHLDTIILRI